MSYGVSALKVRGRGREEQKEGETYKQLDQVKVNVRWPNVERVSGEESMKEG